eukprot:GSA25T00016302001.1
MVDALREQVADMIGEDHGLSNKRVPLMPWIRLVALVSEMSIEVRLLIAGHRSCVHVPRVPGNFSNYNEEMRTHLLTSMRSDTAKTRSATSLSTSSKSMRNRRERRKKSGSGAATVAASVTTTSLLSQEGDKVAGACDKTTAQTATKGQGKPENLLGHDRGELQMLKKTVKSLCLEAIVLLEDSERLLAVEHMASVYVPDRCLFGNDGKTLLLGVEKASRNIINEVQRLGASEDEIFRIESTEGEAEEDG